MPYRVNNYPPYLPTPTYLADHSHGTPDRCRSNLGDRLVGCLPGSSSRPPGRAVISARFGNGKGGFQVTWNLEWRETDPTDRSKGGSVEH
jgi:hypothetical protein